MTPEELMKPRYKVIADYPNSPQSNQIGFVYDRNDKGFTEMWWNLMGHYPHLFRRLQWWEDREEKDMPEYVKCKISCWVDPNEFEADAIYRTKDIGDKNSLCWFLPATLSDYQSYIK